MQVNEIKAQLKTKQLQKFYIFTGPEWKVQHIYMQQIATVANKKLKYIDCIGDVYDKMINTSFLSTSYVYVLRDDKDVLTNEKLQAQLDNILGDNILIFLVTNVDKRLKFYKTYKDTICEFEPLKTEILKKYIQKEINLSDKNCDKLMEVCEYDYGRCLLEVDKIKHYKWEEELVMKGYPATRYDIAFDELLTNGTIYTPPKDAIFDFVDAVLDRKLNTSFKLLEQCIAVGEAVMVMITVLYNNAKAVLQVQSCESKDVSKSTGLTSWQINNARKHAGKYRNRELIDLMELCQQCQQGIVTGTMEEQFVMDYILTAIL